MSANPKPIVWGGVSPAEQIREVARVLRQHAAGGWVSVEELKKMVEQWRLESTDKWDSANRIKDEDAPGAEELLNRYRNESTILSVCAVQLELLYHTPAPLQLPEGHTPTDHFVDANKMTKQRGMMKRYIRIDALPSTGSQYIVPPEQAMKELEALLQDCPEGEGYTVTVVEMDEEEHAALPAFFGF